MHTLAAVQYTLLLVTSADANIVTSYIISSPPRPQALLSHIDDNFDPGAVLVFLPGFSEISRLYDRLAGSRAARAGRVVLVPLHSSVSPAEQASAYKTILLLFIVCVYSCVHMYSSNCSVCPAEQSSERLQQTALLLICMYMHVDVK